MGKRIGNLFIDILIRILWVMLVCCVLFLMYTSRLGLEALLQ